VSGGEADAVGPDDLPLLPLAPFIASLQSIGILAGPLEHRRIALALRTAPDWSADRLRRVLAGLLVRDPEQLSEYERLFDAFFGAAAGAAANPEQRDRVLTRIRALREGAAARTSTPADPRANDRTDPVRPPAPLPRSRRRWVRLAAVLLLLVAAAVLTGDSHSPLVPEPVTGPGLSGGGVTGPAKPVTTQPTEPGPGPALPPTVATRVYAGMPRFGPHESIAGEPRATWAPALAIAGGLLALAGLLQGVRWWLARAPRPTPIPWRDDAGPRHFDPGRIGGPPPPRLAPAVLDELADALGHFQEPVAGRDLDAAASVAATVAQGGLAMPRFRPRRHARRVLVLDDLRTEARAWCPLAAELADGLARRGLEVKYGRFEASLTRFRTPDGHEHHLTDLDDERESYLVLVVSDGRGLVRRRPDPGLETLVRWPRVAWLDPREPRAGDAGNRRIAALGFPRYPASDAGLRAVVRGLLTERAATPNRHAAPARAAVPASGATLARRLEWLLGDALGWAETVALVPPPVSLGLAERLRRHFLPALPAERLARLMALPDSLLTAAGLQLAAPVRATLRTGFERRWSSDQRRQVHDFLYRQFRAEEPKPPDCLAHLGWERRYRWLQLYDPDPKQRTEALARLHALTATPLGGAVRADAALAAELAVLPVLGGRRDAARWRDLLPAQARAIAGEDPLRRVLGRAAAALALAGCLLLGWTGWSVSRPPTEHYLLVTDQGTPGVPLRLAQPVAGDDWQPVGPLQTSARARWDLVPERTYRLSLAWNGTIDSATREADFKASTGGGRRSLHDPVVLDKPCQERLTPHLVRRRCPPDWPDDTRTPWQPDYRGPVAEDDRDAILVVGLALQDPRAPAIADTRLLMKALLNNRSVDWFYEIAEAIPAVRDGQGPLPVTRDLAGEWEAILADLAPWGDRTQLAWWQHGEGLPTANPTADPTAPARDRFQRIDRILPAAGDTWAGLAGRALLALEPLRVAALSAAPTGPRVPELRLAGSNTIGARLAPRLVEAYLEELGARFGPWQSVQEPVEVGGQVRQEQSRLLEVTSAPPGVPVPSRILVRPYGSSTAFRALAAGQAEIGMASRPVKAEEVVQLAEIGDMTSDRNEHIIALDAIAVIVHPGNRVASLTLDQLKRIFACEITDWSQVGGSGGPIQVYARDAKSGTYDTFKSLVLATSEPRSELCSKARRYEDSARLVSDVRGDPNGIGFVSAAYVGEAGTGAKALKLDEGWISVGPSVFAVKTEEYPLSRRLFFYTPDRQSDFVQGFIRFAKSDAGQLIVSAGGFSDLRIGDSGSQEAFKHRLSTTCAVSIDAQDPKRLGGLIRDTQGADRLSITFRFRTGSLDLDNRAADDLDRVVAFLQQPENQGRQLLLLGFADSKGPYQANCNLSQIRADKVAARLRALGIQPALVRGYCEEAPVACDDPSQRDGNPKNRRVEVWLR
jgi:phosphate transport system substrate-binding protein